MKEMKNLPESSPAEVRKYLCNNCVDDYVTENMNNQKKKNLGKLVYNRRFHLSQPLEEITILLNHAPQTMN